MPERKGDGFVAVICLILVVVLWTVILANLDSGFETPRTRICEEPVVLARGPDGSVVTLVEGKC